MWVDLCCTVVGVFVSPSRRVMRKKRTISRLHRATLRRRQQRETGSTQDILQLAKNSQLYSPLLNNYTVNATAPWSSDGSSNMHDHYEAAVVYSKTELIITNLRHFQEYSIEVCTPCLKKTVPTYLLLCVRQI